MSLLTFHLFFHAFSVLGVLFLYPGLATKIFSVFRCKSIVGIEGEVLVADFSIKCYNTTHALYLIVAVAFLCLYIIGIPCIMFLMLWRNRKHLHMKKGEDEPTKEHSAIKAKLGGLYLQYEPGYWVSFIVPLLSVGVNQWMFAEFFLLFCGCVCVVSVV